MLCGFLGAVLSVLPVLFDAPTYSSTASFISQRAPEPGRAGIASLAGQFGIAVNSGGSVAESPEFYAYLLQSRAILEPIVVDSFQVPELGREKRALIDIFEVDGSSPRQRLENGIEALADRTRLSIGRETGVLTITVETIWPSLSLAISRRLLEGLNTFNLQTRQIQASEERHFVEGRLKEARQTLRQGEDELQSFYQRNRAFQNSPELVMERERLERSVIAAQQIVTSLEESYEQARIREVRDTPVITVIEEPAVSTKPNPRGRVRRAVMGLIIGSAIAVFILLVIESVRRKQKAGDPDAAELLNVLSEMRPDVSSLRGRRKQMAARAFTDTE